METRRIFIVLMLAFLAIFSIFAMSSKANLSVLVQAKDNEPTQEPTLIPPVRMWDLFLPFVQKPGPPVVLPTSFENSGFEQGQSYWEIYSTFNRPVLTEHAAWAHSGSWFAWLGDWIDEVTQISQTINISPDQPYLVYWYQINSYDACGNDFFNLYINSEPVWSESICGARNTESWQLEVLDLSDYAGENQTIMFEVTNNFALSSRFLLDDISMESLKSLEDLGLGRFIR